MLTYPKVENFSIPIVLIVFNRPDFAKRLIDALRLIKPDKIYVVADGPRQDHPEDIPRCEATRLMIGGIDWLADVKTRFLDTNAGCGRTPSEGISWVFEDAESAIILEDDCLPSPSFFYFCREMLNRYRDNKEVMMISGNNNLLDRFSVPNSYWFSVNTQTHGWATWRRAWSLYDFYISDWPKLRKEGFPLKILDSSRYARKWRKTFDQVYKSAGSKVPYDCWDFQWTYACWKNQGLNIIPSVNLVSNIGYGEYATHQTPADHPLSNLPALDISFPLSHPSAIIQNKYADLILSQNVYNNRPFYFRVFRKLKKIVEKMELYP